MPELVQSASSVSGLDDSLLGGGGGCCSIGKHELAAGMATIIEPTPTEVVAAEMKRVFINENISKRILFSLGVADLKAEDIALLAALASDSNIQISSDTGLGVAFLNKIEGMSLDNSNTPNELSYLVKAKRIIESSGESGLCESELTSIATIGYNTFEDYGEVVLESMQ